MIANKIAVLFKNIILLASSLILLCVAAEVSYRIYHILFRGIPFTASVGVLHKETAAWKVKRILAGPGAKRPKIFVVGDSFTFGPGVSEGDMYYNVMGQMLDAGISVCAASGYGTLQEYLEIDKYVDRVKPDIVILQVCSNDFINNSWDLETRSYFNNNLMVRPYLSDGRVEKRMSADISRTLVLMHRSRLFGYFYMRYQKLCALLAKNGLIRSVEHKIAEKGLSMTEFREAVSVTERLMLAIKNRVGMAKLIVFTVDDSPVFTEQFRAIMKRNDICFIEDVAREIRAQEMTGRHMRGEDKVHWNEDGNLAAGQTLVRYLMDRSILPRK